jgi:phosphoribosyl 1,2-cyclic phosphodiesterase
MSFKVKFWGARGSRVVPGQKTLTYGGNTSCVEVRCDSHLIILDAGSGICELMEELALDHEPLFMDLLISHMHWDHVLGLPFFTPLYQAKNYLFLHGANGTRYDFDSALRSLMRDSNFPVSFDDLQSQNIIKTHKAGTQFDLRDAWSSLLGIDYAPPLIKVTTLANQHPGGGVFYKIAFAGKQLCYVTDTECAANQPEFIDSLVGFVAGCDLLIMDANYTQEEYQGKNGGGHKRGWGHATWQDCVAVAKRAGVKQLCLFHHNAERTDEEQARIEQQAQAEFTATFAAREGLEVFL